MSDKTDREYRQNMLTILDRFYRGRGGSLLTKDECEAMEYAISSIKTDLKYDLLYEETTHIADSDKKIEPTTKNDIRDNRVKNELEPTTKNNLAVDCISRQVAIDAIRRIHPIDTDYDCTLLDKVDVMYVLSDLPSVTPQEPQSFKWCINCKEYDTEKHCCHRYSKVIRDTVAEIRQEPIIDKIRDEIDLEKRIQVKHYTNTDAVIDAVLEVIDKYKAESEG